MLKIARWNGAQDEMGAKNATSAQDRTSAQALHLVFFTHEALSVEPTFQVHRDQIRLFAEIERVSEFGDPGHRLHHHHH